MMFKCNYCGNEIKPELNFHQDTGERTGIMAICDCAESRVAWETEHRMKMEARKRAQRVVKPLPKPRKVGRSR